jgi:hypothetical protein
MALSTTATATCMKKNHLLHFLNLDGSCLLLQDLRVILESSLKPLTTSNNLYFSCWLMDDAVLIIISYRLDLILNIQLVFSLTIYLTVELIFLTSKL